VVLRFASLPDRLLLDLRGAQQSPSSIPGREIVQVLTEIPAGVESGWHIHPGEEVGYIVAGTVQMMIKDQPTLLLPAGSPFLIPRGLRTTPSTSVPTRAGCCPRTSWRWTSRCPRSPSSGARRGRSTDARGAHRPQRWRHDH
jgi:hypothetical protein